MSSTAETIRNGVDTEQLFGTLDALGADPSLATFQFRVRNRWIGGTHNRTTIRDFYAANQEDTSRAEEFVMDAGEPAILLGTDTGPNPAELLLHALAACLTTSLVYVAAARGVHLTEVESTLEGDMDVRGALGLSDELPQRLRADPSVVPRRRRRSRGEATGSRRARTAALGRLRHGHERRPRHGGRGDLVSTSSAVGGLREGGDQPLTTDFIAAMSALASSVVFVTCQLGDRPWGMTVTAFASVSADPPIVLVSLGSDGATTRAIMSSGRFGVSILAADQLAIARYGSARGATKFLEPFAEPGTGRSASPIVAGALAHLDCDLSEDVQIADHAVLFGRVRTAHACEGTPLVYHRRGYRRLAEPARSHSSTGRNVRCPKS